MQHHFDSIIYYYLRVFQIKSSKMNVQAEMIKYINIARQFPAYYITLIDKQFHSFVNEREMSITEEMIYETNQGKKLWNQTKKFLEKQTALPPFQVHQGLNLSAKDHVKDLVVSNTFGHTGSDKSSFSQRILRYCKKSQGAMAQIIGADFYVQARNTAEMTILSLIIDDGVVDRGHRKTIFNPSYRYIGCKSEVQLDKVKTVFNLTQNKLLLRSQSAPVEDVFAASTMLSVKQPNQMSLTANLSKTQNNNFRKEAEPKRNLQQAVFKQLSQNLAGFKASLNPGKLGTAKNEIKDGKKMSERKQNTRIYYEQGAKITEKYTQIYYSDGTIEENIERHTVYS